MDVWCEAALIRTDVASNQLVVSWLGRGISGINGHLSLEDFLMPIKTPFFNDESSWKSLTNSLPLNEIGLAVGTKTDKRETTR